MIWNAYPHMRDVEETSGNESRDPNEDAKKFYRLVKELDQSLYFLYIYIYREREREREMLLLLPEPYLPNKLIHMKLIIAILGPKILRETSGNDIVQLKLWNRKHHLNELSIHFQRSILYSLAKPFVCL